MIKNQSLQVFLRNSQVAIKENEIVKFGQCIVYDDWINSGGGRGGEVAIPDGSRNYDRLIEVIDGVTVNQTFDRVSKSRIGLRGAPKLVVGGDHQFPFHNLKLQWQWLGRKPMRVSVLPSQQANSAGLFNRHDRTIQVDRFVSFQNFEGNSETGGRAGVQVDGLISVYDNTEILFKDYALPALQNNQVDLFEVLA